MPTQKKEDGKKEAAKQIHVARIILETGKVYVLYLMIVTFPTSHVEISPLKSVAKRNTAPQQQQRKSNDNKKRRTLFQNKISATQRKSTQKKLAFGEGKKRMYVLCSMVVTFPTSHEERSLLKAGASLNTAPQQQRTVQ